LLISPSSKHVFQHGSQHVSKHISPIQMLAQYSQYTCWPGWIYGAFTGSPFQEGWRGQGVRERFQALAVERNVLFVHAGLLPIFKEGLLVGKVAIKLGTQSYPEVNGH
jgi:hypothetical protein